MKDKVRYEVLKTEDVNVFKFTHIETREALDGTKVEVIKGRNDIDLSKLANKKLELETSIQKQYEMLGKSEIKKLLDNYKADCKENLEILKIQLKGLNEMEDAINKVISE